MRALFYAAVAAGVMGIGCGEVNPGNITVTSQPATEEECAERWELPPAVVEAGNEQYVEYESAVSCTGEAQPGAVVFGEFVMEYFGDVVGSIGIYNCRTIAGSDSYSLHAEGRAIDLMIPLDDAQYGGADNVNADPIANWLVEHAEYIGIQYLIWDRARWNASSAEPKDKCYHGESPHYDHIHLELSWHAADGATPFFDNLAPPELPIDSNGGAGGALSDSSREGGAAGALSDSLHEGGTGGASSDDEAEQDPDEAESGAIDDGHTRSRGSVEEGGGCACRHRPTRASPWWLLGLAVLTAGARRRRARRAANGANAGPIDS